MKNKYSQQIKSSMTLILVFLSMEVALLAGTAHAAERAGQEQPRKATVDELAKKGPEAVPAIIEFLESENPNDRYTAVRSLVSMATVSFPILIQNLKHTNEESRRMAAKHLRLVLSLYFDNRKKHLAEVRPKAVPMLLEALKDDDKEVRQVAIEVLTCWPEDKRVFPALIQAQKDNKDNKEVRVAVVKALVNWTEDERVVPALIEALKDPAKEVRFVSARTLCYNKGNRYKLAAEPAIPALIQALEDADSNVREFAACALRDLGPVNNKQAIPSLIEALKAEAPGGAVFEALGKAGPAAKQAIPALIQTLETGNPDSRMRALSTLTKIGPTDKRVVPALARALKDKDPGVRRVAVRELEQMGPAAKQAIPALIQTLEEDSVQDIRLSVMSTLYKIDPEDERFIAALVRAQKDSNEYVRNRATRFLHDIRAAKTQK